MSATNPPPPAPAPPAPAPAQKSSPGWLKWLIGCGIGCGVIVVIIIGLAVAGMWWLSSPGEQIETEAVIADESVAIMHFDGEDLSGFSDMANHFFDEFQEQQSRVRQSELPEELRWIERLQSMQQRDAAAEMAVFLPYEMTFTIGDSPSGSDEISFIGAANFRQFVRPVRMMLNNAAQDSSTFKGHKILHIGDRETLCFYEGTVILASDIRIMEQTLDRIDNGAYSPEQAPEALSGYDSLRGTWPVFGLLENQDRLLIRIADHDPDWFDGLGSSESERDQLLTQVRRITFGLTATSEDALRCELVLDLQDSAATDHFRGYLGERLEQFRDKLLRSGLELDYTMNPDGNRLVTTAEITGMAQAITG